MEKEIKDIEKEIIKGSILSQNKILDLFEDVVIISLDKEYKTIELVTLLEQIKFYRKELAKRNYPLGLKKTLKKPLKNP